MEFNNFNVPSIILSCKFLEQQLTMGTNHMVLCTGKYMCVGLMFLCIFDYIINVIFCYNIIPEISHMGRVHEPWGNVI